MSVESRVEERVALSRPSYIRSVWAIVWKDLSAEMRSRELLTAMGTFALLVILIFNFSLELDARTRATVTSGVLWVTFVFAGTLGLSRSMAVEKDNGCLDGLLLIPVDRTVIFFGKAIGNLIFMLIVELVILPVYSIFYNTNLFNPGLILVIVLGSIGYVAIGTLLSSMAVHTRTRDVILPILLLPLAFPVLLPALRASTNYLQAYGMEFIWPHLNSLIAVDMIYIALAIILFDFVVEE